MIEANQMYHIVYDILGDQREINPERFSNVYITFMYVLPNNDVKYACIRFNIDVEIRKLEIYLEVLVNDDKDTRYTRWAKIPISKIGTLRNTITFGLVFSAHMMINEEYEILEKEDFESFIAGKKEFEIPNDQSKKGAFSKMRAINDQIKNYVELVNNFGISQKLQERISL
jgi:hypothetical protein